MSRIFSPRNLIVIIVILAVIVLSRVIFPVPLPTVVLPAEEVGRLWTALERSLNAIHTTYKKAGGSSRAA